VPDQQHWVCGRHAEWYGRKHFILLRATPDDPATDTDWMIMHWGSAEAAGEAAQRWIARARAEGRSVSRFGIMYLPDGTEMPFREWLSQQMAARRRDGFEDGDSLADRSPT
jgi:hypothetical protein